jgi:hypothetical protein
MAEIVQSLFGVTPQMYQQQQQDRADAQAMRFAQLDPFQQANFAIGRGANMLGGAIGGALGGQDPELQRITMRQQIARQLNPGDPASIQQAIAALQQSGDAEGAMMLQGEYRKLQESGALIGQRTAAAQASLAQATREREPRAAPTTNELTNARAIAATKGPEGSPEYDAAFRAEYQRLTAPKEGADPIQKLILTGNYTPASVEMYQRTKNVADLKPVDKRAVTNVSVGAEIKQAPNIVAAISDFGKSVEPAMTMMQTAQNATTLINQAVRDKNSQAFEAARTTLAKLVGENKLSNEDIRRTGIDPRLVQGALDWVNKKIEGVPNEDIMKQMFAVAKALEDSAATKINTQADRAQAAAKASNFPGDPNLYFPRATPIAAGGTDAAKEARYQAYKRAQEGK